MGYEKLIKEELNRRGVILRQPFFPRLDIGNIKILSLYKSGIVYSHIESPSYGDFVMPFDYLSEKILKQIYEHLLKQE